MKAKQSALTDRARRGRWSRLLTYGIAVVVVVVGTATVYFLRLGRECTGAAPTGELRDRIERSPNFNGRSFINTEPTRTIAEGGYWSALCGYMTSDPTRRPRGPLPTETPDLTLFTSDSSLHVVWLGHSTVLARINGVTVLLDPVFDDRVLLQLGGTDRFHAAPIRREELPAVDVLVVSHDHYDHLEQSTIQYFGSRGTRFIVPLGVGAHLRSWGVADSQIVDLDWWESTEWKSVAFVCTPARHLSGRTVFRMNSTLWSSWAIIGPHHRLYFGGDTGYTEDFQRIGREYGPFDLTVLPIGGYDQHWPDVHMTPEEALDGHQALGGRRLLPVHWGAFDVAIHEWDEPIVRLVAAAQSTDVSLCTPRLGEVVAMDVYSASEYWWTEVE